MNKKVIDILFAFLVFALPFKYIPRIFGITILGGPFGNDLVLYPLLIGFVYTFYCQWKYRNVFFKWGIFKKFILAYVGVLLVSLIWGLINYPYYDQILAGPADQIEKLPKVLALLHSIGIPIAQKTLLEFWMFARPIKGVFFEALYTFGAAYMIFCWYHDRVHRAIDILLKVTTVDLAIVAAYGLVDVCYQNGQMWAQNVLATINPILHADVVPQWIPVGYHVSLFWDSQNRSIFQEPSYFGIYMAFAFPMLWWNILRVQNKGKKAALFVLYLILAFEIFLTQSRMALSVNLGVLVVFAIISLYRRQKELLILLMALVIGGGAAFTGSMQFIKSGQVPSNIGEMTPLATRWQDIQLKNKNIKKDVAPNEKKDIVRKGNKNINASMYIEDNLKSISGEDKKGKHAGSNHTRLTVILTNLEIGKEHPLLGVGTSLRVAYLRDKLDKDPGQEIQNSNRTIDQLGILRGAYGNLGDYAVRFAETGFLGLGLFLMPIVLLLLTAAKRLLKRENVPAISDPILFSGLSFIGSMVTGLSDGLTYTFCGWLMMALCYAIIVKNGQLFKIKNKG